MKPSSVLKYSGWGIVDSPPESPRQTADFFFFYLNQFLLFQGSYVYGHNNHGLLQLHVIMFVIVDPTKCKILLSPDT